MFNWTADHARVLVDHSDPLVAIGLSTVLSQHSDVEVLNKGSAIEAGEKVLVLVLDYDKALAVAKARREGNLNEVLGFGRRLNLRLLVVTSKDTEDEVISALEAGVEGYIELSCDVGDVVEGVRNLARGSRYLCPMAARQIASSLTRSPLTERERDVLSLVASGKSNKAVGILLDISAGTVKAHMKAILSKLDARSRTEAANVARARGLVRTGGAAASQAAHG